MRKILLTLLAIMAFSYISLAQKVNVSWIDDYTGYYTVRLYVQTNDNPPSTPILVGEKKNIITHYTTFENFDINLEPVGIINDRRDYYRYVAYVFRQNDQSYFGYGYSIWLDSDEVYGEFNLLFIPIE
jgi:hypothetical protein